MPRTIQEYMKCRQDDSELNRRARFIHQSGHGTPASAAFEKTGVPLQSTIAKISMLFVGNLRACTWAAVVLFWQFLPGALTNRKQKTQAS